jgi:hypothetical protein
MKKTLYLKQNTTKILRLLNGLQIYGTASYKMICGLPGPGTKESNNSNN